MYVVVKLLNRLELGCARKLHKYKINFLKDF